MRIGLNGEQAGVLQRARYCPGAQVLSRAFRSRFLELHVGDIPDGELATILEGRCALAPSYAAKLVAVMRALQRRRQARQPCFVARGAQLLLLPRNNVESPQQPILSS